MNVSGYLISNLIYEDYCTEPLDTSTKLSFKLRTEHRLIVTVPDDETVFGKNIVMFSLFDTEKLLLSDVVDVNLLVEVFNEYKFN